MRNWSRCPFGAILVLMSGGLCAVAGNDHVHDPFEPTVTREEAVLLSNAMNVAGTNVTLAIRMLADGRVKAYSPALDFAIGNLHFQGGQLDEAALAYQAALARLPKFRSAVMNLGRGYLMQERTQDAINLYQQLVTDGQAGFDILLLLGHALLMEDFPVSAESAYRQSLLLRPKQHEAMLAIENARRLGCADTGMLATLGDLLLDQDQPQDALCAYEAAFAGEEPSVSRMLRAIEGFLSVGDEDRADEMIIRADAAAQARPALLDEAQSVALLRLKAQLARQTGKDSEAMALCRDVLRINPLDGQTMLLLAELQQEAGQLEEAVITCERAARVKGFEADALVRHAQIEVHRERYSKAIPLLQAAQAFEDRPNVARYLAQLKRMAD